jgi:hypothetical protein
VNLADFALLRQFTTVVWVTTLGWVKWLVEGGTRQAQVCRVFVLILQGTWCVEASRAGFAMDFFVACR